jgi:hypothetical protein
MDKMVAVRQQKEIDLRIVFQGRLEARQKRLLAVF